MPFLSMSSKAVAEQKSYPLMSNVHHVFMLYVTTGAIRTPAAQQRSAELQVRPQLTPTQRRLSRLQVPSATAPPPCRQSAPTPALFPCASTSTLRCLQWCSRGLALLSVQRGLRSTVCADHCRTRWKGGRPFLGTCSSSMAWTWTACATTTTASRLACSNPIYLARYHGARLTRSESRAVVSPAPCVALNE